MERLDSWSILRSFAFLAGICLQPLVWSADYDFSALDQHFTENLADYGGDLLVVFYQDDELIYRYQAEDQDEDRRRGLASASKWLSGSVVLAFQERGFFDLDDPIGQYLPQFEAAGKGGPTIRQCFGMSSGISETEKEFELNVLLTLEKSVERIAMESPVVFEPGTQLDYEGDGMQIVGRICEVVTGKDWETLAHEVLFTPLEMDSVAYDVFGQNPAIAGGARATPGDYLKFLRMIHLNGMGPDGIPVLSSESVHIFYENHTRGLPTHYSPFPSLLNPQGVRPDYAFGNWIYIQDPDTQYGNVLASPGAFGTWPIIDFERRVWGIIFMAQLNGYTTSIVSTTTALDLLWAEIDRHPQPEPPPGAPVRIVHRNGWLELDWPDGMLQRSFDLKNWQDFPRASGLWYSRYPRSSELENKFFRVGGTESVMLEKTGLPDSLR